MGEGDGAGGPVAVTPEVTTPQSELPVTLEPGENYRWFGQTPDGRRSSSWAAWVARNSPDVYLVNRTLGGNVKVSMHASGTSQVSFLSDDIAAEWTKPGASRHLERWQRGPEFAPGWTRLFEVVLPGPEMRHFVEAGTIGKLHHVLSCEPDEAVHVTVIAGRSGPDMARLVVGGGAHLASCALDEQTVLVIVRPGATVGPGQRRSR